MNELKRHFRPELLNRIDDIIIFHKLSSEDIEKIARNMLETLINRLKSMEITMHVTDEAVKKIAQSGFDNTYGARPLRRTITTQIEDPVSERMLEGTIKRGDTFTLGVKENQFDFKLVV